MPINEFSILIANRIQEKSNVTISYLASRYEKSPSTIRRTILELNEHIKLEKQFIITDATIISQLSYTDLIRAISALKITDYAANSYERLEYLMVVSFTEKYINLTTMYHELEISQSTRKKDRTLFSDLLKEREFVTKSFPSKGIQIIGEEQHYRIELAKILAKVIEIDENNRIVERLANNPIQKLIYLAFSQYMSKNIIDMNYIEELLNTHEVRINYSSKKFLFVYYLIAFCRIQEGQNVRETNGQEQLLHIGKAFLTDAKLYISDEINSKLDDDAEEKIFQALQAITAHKSVVLIVHKLKLLELVDKVLILENGEVKLYNERKYVSDEIIERNLIV